MSKIIKKTDIDIEKVATAIEADAGESLHDLRQALAEAKAGIGRITTPEQILVRQARGKDGMPDRLGTTLRSKCGQPQID